MFDADDYFGMPGIDDPEYIAGEDYDDPRPFDFGKAERLAKCPRCNASLIQGRVEHKPAAVCPDCDYYRAGFIG